jgi:hypothetical protein
MLHMLRHGEPYTRGARDDAGANSGAGAGAGGSHRAHAARGPTSAEVLAEAAAASRDAARGDGSGEVQQQEQQRQRESQQGEQQGEQQREQQGEQQQQEEHQEQQQQEEQQRTADARERARAEEAALRARDAALDAAAWRRLLSRARVRLACGDLRRAVTGRPALAGKFRAATLGHMHLHLAGAAHGAAAALAPGAPLLIEGARNMVQLSDAQAAAFECKAAEIAAAGGFGRAECAPQAAAAGCGPAVGPVPPGHIAFVRVASGTRGDA